MGVRAFKVAKGLADRGANYLQQAGRILHKLSLAIEGQKSIQAGAITQIQQRQLAIQNSPTSPEVPGWIKDINRAQSQAAQAQADALHAHRVAQGELEDITMFEPYSIPQNSGLGPLETAVLDSLVAHRRVSVRNAGLLAARMSKLSDKDKNKFSHLMSTATTDRQRAGLFTGIAQGASVAHLASVDRYANPVAGATLTFDKQYRIDQGVDYNGSGPIGALGSGIVTEVVKSDPGWDGAYVQYKLTSGPYSGQYVYYAEGVTPLVNVGDVLHPGQPVVQLNSSMEMGFAAGPGHDHQSWAQVFGGGYSEGQRTAAGDAFNKLLTSLGAPAGETLGRPIVGTAPTPSTPL
jgi:hypothetical protein